MGQGMCSRACATSITMMAACLVCVALACPPGVQLPVLPTALSTPFSPPLANGWLALIDAWHAELCVCTCIHIYTCVCVYVCVCAQNEYLRQALAALQEENAALKQRMAVAGIML